MRKHAAWQSSRAGRLRCYALAVGAYLCATWFTAAYFMGDTLRYTDSIIARLEGRYYYFWEFGHLFWRPLVWISYRALRPLTALFVGPNAHQQVTLTLIVLTWLAGLGGVLVFAALMRLLCRREWIAEVATLAFICTNAFLNYLHTGCPYVPGLACLLAGLYLLLKDDAAPASPGRVGLLAGAALACAVGFWLPYVLSLPAIALAPLVLFAPDRRRVRLVVSAGLACAGIGAAAYIGAAVFGLGITSLAGFQAWFADASHGLTNMGGVPRAVFGFARSLINMGEDGRIFKRYVVRDPFNPVSLFDLFRLSLWKLGLFYAFMATLVVSLLRSSQGRRILLLLSLNAVPLFGFAIFLFDAGQIERYLPLYPLLFLALTCALCSERVWPALKLILLAYVAIASVTNLSAMSKRAIEAQRAAAEARTRDLWPVLTPASRVFTSHGQDEMVRYNINFVFNPISRAEQTAYVIDPNTSQVPYWRQRFAEQALTVWQQGGDVWLAKRLLAPHPRPEWNWVEGDDPRVSWPDLSAFFAPLATGQAVGGADGFILLAPTPENKDRLAAVAREQ